MPRDATARLLKPGTSKPKRRASAIPRSKPFTTDDSLWTLVGLGKSRGPTDVSVNKGKYLAEAYDAKET
jgi:hypothetical protein